VSGPPPSVPAATTPAAKKSAASASSEKPGLSRKRRLLVWALVVVGAVILLVSILTTWVQRQMLDNGTWKSASQNLIQDPVIQNTLSVYIVNQLYDNIDVAAALEKRLPAQLDPLAAPLAGALRGAATNTVNVLLQRPRVQQVWVKANGVAHQKLVNLLEDKTRPGTSTAGGNVTLDLSVLIKNVAAELGLPQTAIAKIPADIGQITVLKSNQLDAAQKGVKVINVLSVWLLIAVLAIFAAAIYLARGIRRATLRNIAYSFIIVGLIVLLVRRFVGNYVVDSLTDPEYQGSVNHVWLIGSSILGDIGRAMIFYGVIGLIGALFAGPTRIAVAVRSRLAPTFNQQPGVAWGALGLLFLLLVLWGPTHALKTWWGILLLAGLLALGLWALLKDMRKEFPQESSSTTPESPASPEPG